MPYRSFNDAEVSDIFSYHAPDVDQVKAYSEVNAAFIECAKRALAQTPDGPGKTSAVRKLNEARNAFNSAIALRGEF